MAPHRNGLLPSQWHDQEAATTTTAAAIPAASRRSGFVTAIPHTRRLFRTKTAMRIVSLAFAIVYIVSISVLGTRPWTGSATASMHWITGGPMAFCVVAWNTSDLLALFSRHGATPWNRPRPARADAPPPSDTWGHPGLHVAAHLTIWLFALVGMMVLFAISAMELSETEVFLHSTRSVIMIIHFIFFILACVDADAKSRNSSTVIFVPAKEGRPKGYAPPSTLWETVRPRKQEIGYYADQFVRFVSREHGHVQVAGEYASRPGRC